MLNEKIPVPKLLVSKREAAAALGCSVRLVEIFLAQKELPMRKLGKRTLIPWGSVQAFARRDHATKPQAEPTGGKDDENNRLR